MPGIASKKLQTVFVSVFACLAALASRDVPAEIYKKVLPDGTVSYSSEPLPNAEKINPPEPQVIPALKPPADGVQQGQTPASAPPPYTGLDIVEPADDQVIWNNAREVEVSVSLTPPLKAQQGHRLVIMLDGSPVNASSEATRLILTEVDRGTHTLTAEVHDIAGRILLQSAPTTFHLKQHSALLPPR